MKLLKQTLLFTMIIMLPFSLVAADNVSLPAHYIKSTLIERGDGRFRRLGFHVYDAKLWTQPNQNTPPYALQLKYAMNITSTRIVNASIKEMRALGVSEEQLKKWEATLGQVLPSVKKGDVITGFHLVNAAEFYLNGQLLGRVDSAEFANNFFGIWLSPKTSAPAFRQQLLQIK